MRKLLVVVDCQKDFIDGALGFEGADKIIPGIIARIGEYKASGDEVVYTLDTHTEDYMNTQEGRNLPVPHCIKDSEGFALDAVLAPHLEGCKAFEKPTFGSMDLAEYIRDNASEYSAIELCGLVSNICVISNAVIAKAAAPEAEIIVDSKLTASFDPALHEAALAVLGGIQVKVV
ncbi:MAG: cysteine hydrolase [Clostridiales bacterium]|nr:cysteine hydrolase [Clostridiales bacterium]MBR5358101.1 cysteine hydrolase [Clostridiales bacterium]